jgi:hypothetical protein
MRHWRTLLVGVGLSSLLGCTGMTSSECELADWQAVGFEDGSLGHSADVFARHRKGCAKHDVAPDFTAYRAGRDAGLREYCQPARGFREGARGAEYLGVCPPELEDAFFERYEEGRALYELEYAVRSTHQKLTYKQQRIKDIEIRLAENLAATLASDTPGEERARLLVETRQLTEERLTLTGDVERLERELRLKEDQLSDHRAQMMTRL